MDNKIDDQDIEELNEGQLFVLVRCNEHGVTRHDLKDKLLPSAANQGLHWFSEALNKLRQEDLSSSQAISHLCKLPVGQLRMISTQGYEVIHEQHQLNQDKERICDGMPLSNKSW